MNEDMNKDGRSLLIAMRLCLLVLAAAFVPASAEAQTPGRSAPNAHVLGIKRRPAFPWPTPPGSSSSAPAAGPSFPVIGSGTLGRLAKWTGFTGSNSVIGDTTIFEDKFGNVGIGTDSPTSKLTVNGTIQASGGSSVLHDVTLQGTGTSVSPLGVAVPLILNGAGGTLGIVRATNTTDGGGGVLGIGGNSSFRAGGFGVAGQGGDSTMGEGGFGLIAVGGSSDSLSGGIGVLVAGGVGAEGGSGMLVQGGFGKNLVGGDGVLANGGGASGPGNRAGNGITASGGTGENGAANGLAGQFKGDVQVTGNLSKGGGSFKIDHPLDPENKYLYHSFVESPDMKNIYDGTVTTDANADAIVELPDYFEALNRDFRYQLTVIGTFAQAIVSHEIESNQFRIKTSAPNVKVSWQVTGIRHDAYANKHRIPVGEAKPESERGTYLHPDSFNQPEEKGVVFAQRPDLMRRMKELRDNPNR